MSTQHPSTTPKRPTAALAGLVKWKLRKSSGQGDGRWYLNPNGFRNAARLMSLRNAHLNKRCFIICNGPSLRKMDLSPLKNEYTIGLNRIYLMVDEIGFVPSYYVCINRLVLEQCAKEIAAVPTVKFIEDRSRDIIQQDSDTLFLRSLHYPHFSFDLTAGFWQGATVTYAAMQVAFWLGFQTVILIGCDHHYERAGKPHQEVVSEGDDPDHFAPNYFGKGFRWHLPDLEKSEVAYSVAKVAYAEKRRELLDATVGGKLTIFPKVDYNSLFNGADDSESHEQPATDISEIPAAATPAGNR